jgi:hypothetical protein
MNMRLSVLAVIVTVAAAIGCGGDGNPSPPAAGLCEPPNRVVGDNCLEPGVQDDGCPAGTLGQPDGSCRPAGMLAEDCPDAFDHVPFEEQIEGASAIAGHCEPILPAEPCPKGQMAVPGETACHPVMPCGAGTWGDIPVDANTVYVDASYLGNDGDGSSDKPWTTISDAVAAVASGALIAVASGSYVEDVVISKFVRLWGVCPDQVELAGSVTGIAALTLRAGASASEVHGIAVTGEKVGIGISGAADVIVEQVWVHDALGRGVVIENELGPTSVTLRNSLVEDNQEIGARISGSSATLEDVVIRRTLPEANNQMFGRGISISDAGVPATVIIQSSVIEDNRTVGVVVTGSAATFEGVVVRGTLPRASDLQDGVGIAIQENPASGAPATAIVKNALIEENHEVGVRVFGAEATLEGLVVRHTQPRALDLQGWGGITIQLSAETGRPASAAVTNSLIEDNHVSGVIVLGSDATFDGVVVRRTMPRASDQNFGQGIHIQNAADTGSASNVIVTRSLVEDCHAVGVFVLGSNATLDALLVRRIEPQAMGGLFGDGVLVASLLVQGTPKPATALVTRSQIEESARAGLLNFSSHVTLGTSALSCNGFDLNGEIADFTYTYDNIGGNGCGCPEPTSECTAQTSGLVAPESI